MSNLATEVRRELPYYNRKEVLEQDQDTNDIVRWIAKLHPVVAGEYDQVAELHWKGNAEDTARHLFKFLKDNVSYSIESPDDQTIKKPGAILYQGHGDCKHYASYIVGVCDSLNRAGYPIAAKYRFTADRPGLPVHHVFAVVSGPNKAEYWVDPVVDRFNKRPTYHNIKDKDMSLSLISGTENGDNGIGKKHNIFKDIAHGLKVSSQNLKHGLDVAAHDTGKGIKYAAKDTGKAIKVAANQIKAVALKVAGAPARNAFLGLVDFNILNLAKHLHDALNSSHRGGLLNDWKNLGGNGNKLQSAVNNGIKWYNKHHGKKISGLNLKDAIAHYQKHTYPWHGGHVPHQVHKGRRFYQMRGMQIGCSCSSHSGIGCSGNAIGCLPACAPAMLALASAIIAALKKYLAMSPDEDKALANGAKAGAADLIQGASAGIDIANGDAGPAAAQALDTLTTPGSNTPSMKVSTGTDSDGTPTLAIHDVDHPVINNAGRPMQDQYDDNSGSMDNGSRGGGGNSGPGVSDMIHDVFEKGKQFISDYKMPLLFVGAGVGIYKYSTRKKKRR